MAVPVAGLRTLIERLLLWLQGVVVCTSWIDEDLWHKQHGHLGYDS